LESEDIEILSAVFAVSVIREGFGKLYCNQRVAGILIMPEDGMCMWPWLFLYLPIPERCWLGVHRSPPHPESANQGVVCSKSAKKIRFEGTLCYLAFSKAIGLQKEELLRDRTPDGRFQNLFSTAVAKAAA
jgi:hypothetical protein